MTNIALVVLDTLRKDAFEEQFGWLPGVRYESAWSPSGWTVPVHGALFGGGYPREVGVYAKTQSLTCAEPVLAETLSDAGYTTRGFSANANISDAFEFTRGFDEFDHSWRGKRRDEDVVDWGAFISEMDDEGRSRFLRALYRTVVSETDTLKSLRLGLKLKARDLGIETIAGEDDGAKKALRLVEQTDFGDDEFLFMNLMEAHGPYKPPSDYDTTNLDYELGLEETIFDGPDADAETVRSAYDDCVRYLSDVYAEIFAVLEADFDYILTLSDHGEMFGTAGIWDHNHGIYPELTHVPLCISDGRESIDRRHETVSLVDVHRTVLDLAGCEPGGARGQNLYEDSTADDYLVERHGLRAEWVEPVKEMKSDGELFERYDQSLRGVVFEDGSYAWETPDGLETRSDVDLDGAERRLDGLVCELDTAEVRLDDSRDAPDDVEARLEDLGYM